MGSIPLPALGIKQQEQPDLMGNIAKMLQLKQMQQQGQLQQANLQGQQLQNQQAQTQMSEDDAYKQALAANGGDPRKALPDIMKVAPSKGLALKKQLDEWDKSDTEHKLKILEVHEKQVSGLGQLAATVKDEPSFQAALQQAVQGGLVDPQQAQQMAQQGYDPQKVAEWQQQAVSVQQGIQNKREELSAEETKRHNQQMEARQPAGSDSTRFVDAFLKSHNLADTPANNLKAQREWIKESKIAPAAVRAEIYMKAPIAVGDPDHPGETLMVPKNKAAGMAGPSSASVTVPRKVDEYMTSGKGGQQITAYNTAIAHLDTLRDMGMALGNGNVQRFNSIAQKWAEETGSPAPASFDAAKAALSGEVAAALKASGATDQEIAQVQSTFSKKQSNAQFTGVINTYQKLLKSKKFALQKQYQSGMSGQPAFEGATEQPQQGNRPPLSSFEK